MRFPTGYVVSVGLYCIILEIRAELPDNLECDSSNMGTLLFSGSAGGKVWFYIYNELISEDAAEILCECRNQTLAYPNTETYRLILKGLMKARSVPSVWVNGNKRIMSHWEFIDEDRTVLSRSEITQGSGNCGVLYLDTGDNLNQYTYKARSCSAELTPLVDKEECDLTCYQTSGEVSSWYKAYSDVSYNLATPITDDSFKDYAFYKRDYRPLHDDREYWIGLRKEIYEWIDNTEVENLYWDVDRDEPQAGGGDCMYMTVTGLWGNDACTGGEHHVVCMGTPPPTPVRSSSTSGTDANMRGPSTSLIVLLITMACLSLIPLI